MSAVRETGHLCRWPVPFKPGALAARQLAAYRHATATGGIGQAGQAECAGDDQEFAFHSMYFQVQAHADPAWASGIAGLGLLRPISVPGLMAGMAQWRTAITRRGQYGRLWQDLR